ncbi:unnamed protein product [Prorocentrum cordatum]|uniref:Uncharacterized protein n=1 Tax=Prorocentrum cordatum TaxID=2364126 RepID=A0ABN9QIH4_9DINO|nr:unnamed protein product [Polarella glacialis]CAK0822450.1 unnamed protein product [Polarella glacialis]
MSRQDEAEYDNCVDSPSDPETDTQQAPGGAPDAAHEADGPAGAAPDATVPTDSAAAGEPAGEERMKCCTCGVMKLKAEMKITEADAATGAKLQCRCLDCNGLRGRLYRMCKQDDFIKNGFAEMGPDVKIGLNRIANRLAGEALKKVLLTAIHHNRIQKRSEKFEGTGNFVNIADIKDAFIEKEGQAAWDEYYMNAPKITCPIYNKPQIWKPEWSLTITNENSESLEERRKIEGEERVPKKPRRQLEDLQGDGAHEGGEAAEEGEEDAGRGKAGGKGRCGKGRAKAKAAPRVPAERPITVTHKTRLDGCQIQLEQMHMNMSTLVSEASAADMVENIAPKHLKGAKQLLTAIDTVLKNIAVIKQTNTASPASLKAVWDGFKEAKATNKDYTNKIKTQIEEGKAGD